MSTTELHGEDARQRRISNQMRDAILTRFTNPDADDTLDKVWVAHVWIENGDGGEWMLAGFRRRRYRRKPQTMGWFFGKIRRQFQLDKSAPVMLMDLGLAKRRMTQEDQEWRYRPPQFQDRKAKMEQRTPEVDRTKRKQRATIRAFKLSKQSTKFIALGRMGWDKTLADGSQVVVWERAQGFLYLGPLRSDNLKDAKREAAKMFSVYRLLHVIPTSKLSKHLRTQMARGTRVKAGTARIVWPEVPPDFDTMYGKFVRKQTVELSAEFRAAIETVWEVAGKPWLTLGWLRKQMRLIQTPTKVVWLRGAFQCTKCKRRALLPYAIVHDSPRCVSLTIEESATCATDARAHAKKLSDRKRKRLQRRTEQKTKAAKAKARTLAAKKAARTKAKQKIASAPKRSLRSIVSHVRSAIASAKTKIGRRTRIGTSAMRSMPSKRVAKSKPTHRKAKR